jgi:hypothetical protein
MVKAICLPQKLNKCWLVAGAKLRISSKTS